MKRQRIQVFAIATSAQEREEIFQALSVIERARVEAYEVAEFNLRFTAEEHFRLDHGFSRKHSRRVQKALCMWVRYKASRAVIREREAAEKAYDAATLELISKYQPKEERR